MFSFAPKSGISETSQTQLVKIERKSVEKKKKKAKLKPINFRKQAGLGKPPVVIYLVHFRGLSVVANYANC